MQTVNKSKLKVKDLAQMEEDEYESDKENCSSA